MMGTWSRIYDGGDLEAVVRGSTLVCATASSTDASCYYNDLLTRSGCSLENHDKGVTQSKDHASESFVPLKDEHASDQDKPTILSPPQEHKAAVTLDASSNNKVVHSNSATVKIEPNVHNLTRLPGIRRRKSQQRRIMCVPAAGGLWNKHGGGGVPSDLWAWRKYGQKPIKGSPYPRGYYRCSSSKGCPARKQIERSHTDPTLLVITYTAEHNHAWPACRNALARSSRQSALRSNTHELSVPVLHHDSSPHSSAKLSPAPTYVADGSASAPHSEDKMELHCVQNQQDDSAGIDQDLGFRADHDLFAGLGELPELYPKDFTLHSDDEAPSTVIDPFDLFNWAPLANNTPNS
ncbi:hypothetical protein SUGI_0783120 [Cryptomeria japonica]|uniref:WRKY transcription factor 22 n=1 Tax=Cryptomeria japonica TaxID=3369 RepID=UPI002414A539|nr:WRKY transcription factor 22 [Cryptomeria japonica]GLJ38456.1 hypothetical protein SUGI_0783120 [Cryptomeria japonica]